MKRIGILTFHRVTNYGAVLQAYALKQVCDDLGYETHIINYKNPNIEEYTTPVRRYWNSSRSARDMSTCLRGIMSYWGDRIRRARFSKFRKCYLNESVACTDITDIQNLYYDCYIAGSDQIWNYHITGEQFDPAFFLQFDTKAKKIIYAASSQDTPFPKDKEINFCQMLCRTKCPIGIREEKLAAYVEKITGKRHPVVLDPTLLAGRAVLDRIQTPKIRSKPYILLYQIDTNPYTDISVKSLEARFRCPVYTMTVPRLGATHGRRGTAGPEMFLSLLKGAEFLVTNSFHGVALSLLYEKSFFVYDNGGVMSRIDGLLHLCGLMDRKVKLVCDIDENNKINYEAVGRILEKARQMSMEFLKTGFQGEEILVPEYQCNMKKSKNCVKEYEKNNCCGCSACMYSCPTNAITMKKDREGFLYPDVNANICIRCGKCVQVCGFHELSEEERPLNTLLAYGAKHNDFSERTSSRSGGAFIAFSDIVLSNGGSIYGAVMNKDFSVSHTRATNKAQRDLMKKAKYVQSDIRGVFPEVVNDLQQGKQVLFSGTPCQVSGLQSYLKFSNVDTKNLICCDLVCHGVPSPAIWHDYIELIENKYKGRVLNAQFRDKEFGWDSHVESFEVAGRKKKVVTREYTDLFYQHIMFRPSCHNCQFSNLYRPGDLALADFWGIEKHDPGFNDNKGVSLIFVSTEKGKKLFEEARPMLSTIECQAIDCLQPTLVKPSTASPRREMFWKDYLEMDFADFIKKYTTPTVGRMRLKKKIKELLYFAGIRKHP